MCAKISYQTTTLLFFPLLYSKILLISLSLKLLQKALQKTRHLTYLLVLCSVPATGPVRSVGAPGPACLQIDRQTWWRRTARNAHRWSAGEVRVKQPQLKAAPLVNLPPGLYLFSGSPCLSSDQPCPLLCYWAPLTKSPTLSLTPHSILPPFLMLYQAWRRPPASSRCLLWYAPIDGAYGGHIFP